MKKGLALLGIFLLFLALLFFSSKNVSAELNNTKIDNAYSCLQNKTRNCSVSIDDNIFTLLSLKTCRQDVLDDSQNEECWPRGSCTVKQTALALLALKESGSSSATDKGKAWLISRTKPAPGIEWYLQIESNEPTTCTISYGNPKRSYSVSIGADKKINSNAGTCLSLATDQGNYWLKFSSSPQCQTEYEISCDKDFITNTLFKEQSSTTIHVSDKINSASARGVTVEKVNSSCFADSSSCSYEGTLWASLVLSSFGRDVSPYIPYLVVMADNNPRYLPESFLYVLLGENYKQDLLSRQKSSKYWEASGDRYFDTALALLALGSDSDTDTEEENSIDWLMESQGSDGCWQSNIKNTGFILYAIAPRSGIGSGGDTNGSDNNPNPSCTTAGYFCSTSTYSCSNIGGNVLDAYSCPSSFQVCCDKQREISTCTEQQGEICSSNEICSDGIEVESSDAGSGTCCVSGSCVPRTDDDADEEENSCELNDGICRKFECENSETQDSSFDCDLSSEVCCIEKTTPKISSAWIWILLVLIILVVIAIVFREKLRAFWLRVKTTIFKPKSGSAEANKPSSMPLYPFPLSRPVQRRILPPSHSQQHRPAIPQRKPRGELDEVLKKLKEMSK